jgi:hypothetical protein
VRVLTLLDRDGEDRADNGQSGEEELHFDGGCLICKGIAIES